MRSRRRTQSIGSAALESSHWPQLSMTSVRPNRTEMRVADRRLSKHPTACDGKVHRATVLNICSQQVMGWTIGTSYAAALVTNSLGMVDPRRSP